MPEHQPETTRDEIREKIAAIRTYNTDRQFRDTMDVVADLVFVVAESMAELDTMLFNVKKSLHERIGELTESLTKASGEASNQTNALVNFTRRLALATWVLAGATALLALLSLAQLIWGR